ncbi:MAG: ATP-dependent DNA helicase [Gammaproteobacteria bacterium]
MNVVEALGREGALARQVQGFAPRPQQQRMAQAVADTLSGTGVLIAEAGTGTGKTFAYLVPALLSGKKVIVSTGTRNLQDQLFFKDLPIVRKALGVSAQVAMLKGRANYLCRHRFALTEASGRLESRAQVAELARVGAWLSRTQHGDIAEVAEVAEDSALWPRITSTTDNCLGQDCTHWQECFVVKARRRAQDADLLVVNHHLFCVDMAMRETGFAEILPGADAFIIDEAHQLPDVASHFFGLSLGSQQIIELARDTAVEQRRDAPDFTVLGERARKLEKIVADLRVAFGPEPRRAPWAAVAHKTEIKAALAATQSALGELAAALAEAGVRGKGLASCAQRCAELQARLQRLGGEADADSIHWFETYTRSFTLSLTPLEVSKPFAARMAKYPGAWVFTSATLAIGEDFSHFAGRLGVREFTSLRVESPFDYVHNAVLYHPKGLPDPAAPEYGEALLEAVLPVLEASRGRAFVLFTSHHALQEASAGLQGRVAYPLLVQGSLPKAALLERFRQLGNAVLLGTTSFWEGVDVRGEALSCVIITKLPFASPGDPVVEARIAALRQRGGNPFMDFQLPQAVIALKQGVGRLIRDVHDRGVLMLCDPRLLTKSYGRVFLASLPPMNRTRSLDRVRSFFAAAEAQFPAEF